MGSRPYAILATALVFVALAGSANGGLHFYTLAGYRTVGDFYGYDGDPPLQGLDIGTQSASLNYTGAGPYDFSTFSFDGSATAGALALKAASSIDLSGYLIGSYVGQAPDWNPSALNMIPAGFGYAEVTDQIMFTGPPGFYTLEFNYEISGSTDVVPQHIHSRAATGFSITPHISLGGFFGQQASDPVVTDSPGAYSATSSLEVYALPDVWYEFTQSFNVATLIADSFYASTNDPLEDGDWDPANIAYWAPIVAEHPYKSDWWADFSHSMVLTSVVIRDSSGAVAPGIRLTSANGVDYPDGFSTVPEPSTRVMLSSMGLIFLALRSWRRKPG